MIIVDAIRSARDSHAVFFLVTSYIESLRHFASPESIPEFVIRLPIANEADLAERIEMILGAKDLSVEGRQPTMEALSVFRCARERLCAGLISDLA